MKVVYDWFRWWVESPKWAWVRLWRDIKSQVKWKTQKLTRGYSDLEVWNVGPSVATYALPIMKEYRKNCCGYPAFQEDDESCNTYEHWLKTLDKIIFALEAISKDDCDILFDKEGNKKVQEGSALFGKHLMSLWD